MGNWTSLLMAVQVLSSLAIIGLVLLQQGKGADMGSAFGSGSAGSVFGAAGAANFLSRMTKWAAILFFITTGALAWVAHHPAKQEAEGVMQGYESVVPGAGGSSTSVENSVPSLVPAAPAEPAAESAVPDLQDQGAASVPAQEPTEQQGQ